MPQFTLGESPSLAFDGRDLIVRNAYQTQDGRWHELVVSNGYDLSNSQLPMLETARKIQSIWASCIGGVEQSYAIAPSQAGFVLDGKRCDVWITRNGEETAHQFLQKEGDRLGQFITENDRVVFLLGQLSSLSEPIPVEEGKLTTVAQAMALLNHILMPHRVEHGPIDLTAEESVSPAPDESEVSFDRGQLEAALGRKIQESLEKQKKIAKFPFTSQWNPEENEFQMPEAEKSRIHQAMRAYLDGSSQDPDVKDFMQDLTRWLGKESQIKKMMLEKLLKVFEFKEEEISEIIKLDDN